LLVQLLVRIRSVRAFRVAKVRRFLLLLGVEDGLSRSFLLLLLLLLVATKSRRIIAIVIAMIKIISLPFRRRE